jgi:hypothetical protein
LLLLGEGLAMLTLIAEMVISKAPWLLPYHTFLPS